jgi:hypothetical protein
MTIALVSSILFLFPTSTAYSQDSTGGDDWSFELAPLYLWGTSITGDMTLKGNPAEVDAGLGDIFDNLNGFFTIHFDTAWKQKVGGFADVAYGSLEASKDTPLDGTITPKLTMFISELAGFYRLNKGAHKLDFFGGIRYTDIDGKLEFSGPLGTQKGSESWVDPMFGLLWKWRFADKWAFRARGDIGGFGAGSDFAWSAAGLVDWRPWKHVGFWFGYRALYQDYKTGSDPEEFAFDATMHGPIIALNTNW